MLLEKMTFTALMWPLPAPLAPQRPNLTHRIKIKPNRDWQGRRTSHTMVLNYSTQLRSAVYSTHTPTLHLEPSALGSQEVNIVIGFLFFIHLG